MDKVLDIGLGAWGDAAAWGSPVNLVHGSEGHIKTAAGGDFHPDIERWLERERPSFTKNDIVLVITPLGQYETWGSNVNGDAFERRWVQPEDPDWGHKSFETHAKAFLHHINKDPTKGFGTVPLSVFDEHMKRVEFILRVDRELADRVGAGSTARDLDRGILSDISMGCRVPFDICSICGNRARSAKNYCEHLRSQMNHILPDGKMVCALNPRPRFFDISFVFVRAAKESAILAKVASAIGSKVIPSHLMAEIAIHPDGRSMVKAASDKIADVKLAELLKQLPPVFTKVVHPLYRSEEPLPEKIIDMLASHPLSKSLSSTASMGIVLRPREFQKIILIRTGRPELADRLHSQRTCFCPCRGDDHAYAPRVSDIVQDIVSALSGSLGSRSVLQPFISRRIIRLHVDGERRREPEVTEKTGGVLVEVGREYARYINGMTRLPSFLKAAVSRYGSNYDVFAAASYDPMAKAASITATIGREYVLPAMFIVLPTYLLAAKWHRRDQRGEDVGLMRRFVADNPLASSMGLLAGSWWLGGKVPMQAPKTRPY